MQTSARTFRQHARQLLVLGLPLVGSNLVQHVVQLTDTLMLGWYDVTALAAVTLATSFYFVVFILGTGFGWAVMPIVAEAQEAGDEVRARRATRMGMWLSVLYGLCALPLFWWSGPLLSAFGQAPEIAGAAQSWLRIAGPALIPVLIFMSLRSFLSALEHTRVIFWTALATGVMNAGLDAVLIFGLWGAPELGIRGAAIATAAAQTASGLCLVLYAHRKARSYDLFSRLWRPDAALFGKLLRMGLPIGLTSLAEVGLFSVTTLMMGWLGEIPLAAHGIALQVSSATFVVHLGLSQAATVRAGRAYGRRDEEALRRGGLAALGMALVVALATVAVFLIWPVPLIGLFIDPADPARGAILQVGVTLLAIAALFQVVDACQVLMLGLLRGVQDTAVPMVVAAISYWGLGVPAGWLLGFPMGWGAAGIWMGLVVGLGAAAVMLTLRFWGGAVRIAAPA